MVLDQLLTVLADDSSTEEDVVDSAKTKTFSNSGYLDEVVPRLPDDLILEGRDDVDDVPFSGSRSFSVDTFTATYTTSSAESITVASVTSEEKPAAGSGVTEDERDGLIDPTIDEPSILQRNTSFRSIGQEVKLAASDFNGADANGKQAKKTPPRKQKKASASQVAPKDDTSAAVTNTDADTAPVDNFARRMGTANNRNNSISAVESYQHKSDQDNARKEGDKSAYSKSSSFKAKGFFKRIGKGTQTNNMPIKGILNKSKYNGCQRVKLSLPKAKKSSRDLSTSFAPSVQTTPKQSIVPKKSQQELGGVKLNSTMEDIATKDSYDTSHVTGLGAINDDLTFVTADQTTVTAWTAWTDRSYDPRNRLEILLDRINEVFQTCGECYSDTVSCVADSAKEIVSLPVNLVEDAGGVWQEKNSGDAGDKYQIEDASNGGVVGTDTKDTKDSACGDNEIIAGETENAAEPEEGEKMGIEVDLAGLLHNNMDSLITTEEEGSKSTSDERDDDQEFAIDKEDVLPQQKKGAQLKSPRARLALRLRAFKKKKAGEDDILGEEIISDIINEIKQMGATAMAKDESGDSVSSSGDWGDLPENFSDLVAKAIAEEAVVDAREEEEMEGTQT